MVARYLNTFKYNKFFNMTRSSVNKPLVHYNQCERGRASAYACVEQRTAATAPSAFRERYKHYNE